MPENQFDEVEKEDAKKVDAAIDALFHGNIQAAVVALFNVVSRAPETYIREFMAGDTRYIKFWDVQEFTHFVTDKCNKIEHKIVWLSSAYPRAFYYLGFAHVKLNDLPTAVQFLERGYELEPNPLFLLECGKAFSGMNRHDLALASYEEALARHGSARAQTRAVAMRGRGFQLIELGQLDLAEEAFNDSLKLDPNNPVALNELRYIQNLRKGGRVAPPQTVVSGNEPLVCAVCGEKLKGAGKVTNVDGRVVWRCSTCAALLPAGPGSPGLPSASDAINVRIGQPERSKPSWWQFWKR